MIYLFLAAGFEEIEALATLDVLRRAELDVYTVGIASKTVTGSHGIPVVCDVMDCEIMPSDEVTGIVLPGGMPGTLNLEKSDCVLQFIKHCFEQDKLIAAICAAPSILGHLGMLSGKRAVCFPGYEQELENAILLDIPVCVNDNIITARGAGVSIPFALEIVRAFKGDNLAEHLEAAMQCVK